MKLTIREAIESDAPALAAINITAFAGDSGFIANAFPNIEYNAIHALKTARFQQKMAHPGMKIYVAEDEESGNILGCARWRFPVPPGETEPSAAGTELVPPPGTNRDIYDGFFDVIKQRGKVYLRDDDIVLEFIATVPEYQGKGVAKTLLNWGLEQANSQRRRIFLEATVEGYPVYVKNGWAALERFELDYGEWGGRGVQVMTLMMRDPSSPSFNR